MKRHAFDALSFVSGLLALVTGLLFLFPGTPGELIDRLSETGEWLLPILLIAVGVVVLTPLLARARAQGSEETEI